jgi:hypothetical protein
MENDLNLIFILENIIWLAIPAIFSLVAYCVFKYITKKSKKWLFIFLILFSIASYFYVRPGCAGIGIGQLICTAQVASFFNFILFILGLIVALVFNRLMSRNPKK